MNLEKLKGFKSAIVAATVGLVLAFSALIKSETNGGTTLEAGSTSESPDYETIFTPGQSSRDDARESLPVSETGQPRPDTRTRAS